MTCNPKKLIAILGPTASGKSAVALELARHIRGEIVSCDSMQVYRELTVGTAKPSAAECAEIPHHLINVVGMSERFDGSRFVQAASAACQAAWQQGKTPILTGGTGLYAKAFIYGFSMQPADPGVFKDVCETAGTDAGLLRLKTELTRAFDGQPVPAELLENPRRLIRAVEVLRITGRPPGLERKSPPDSPEETGPGQGTLVSSLVIQCILMPPNSVLKQRISTRTRYMLESGWIEETRELAAKGLFDTPTAYQALGYREIWQWLQTGGESIDSLQNLIATKTWQYARRQMTWFRRQHPGAYLLTLRPDYDVPGIVKAVLSLIP